MESLSINPLNGLYQVERVVKEQNSSSSVLVSRRARHGACSQLSPLPFCRFAALVVFFFLPSSAFIIPHHVCVRHSNTALCGESPNKSNTGRNRHDDFIPVDSVTDAEALLACRAYLQRKNRLGSWKDYKRRKESLRQASAIGSAAAGVPESVGYFWENPEELIYLDRHDEDDENEIMHEEEIEQVHGVVMETVEEEDGGTTMILGTTMSALERGAEFTSLPTSPTQERINRSNAAKKRWSDAEWVARWYEKRWGRLRNMTPSASKQKRLDDKIRAMPPKMFEAQELLALTEEEIEEAIRTYVVSNRKRSRAHTTDAKIEKKKRAEKEEAERRKGMGEKAKIDFMFGSEETMKEAQRKRSERAAKAYQTRLANQNKRRQAVKRETTVRSVPTDSLPSGDTPQDALVRVQAALVSGQLPSISDVELILEPSKLGRRKDLLRRILNEYFDLRGKCVPADLSAREDSDLLFVTQCSIDQLGSFVVKKMKESDAEESGA